MDFQHEAFETSEAESTFVIEKRSPSDRVIALAGNPNVGKSTVFNELTGMKQHTGNWPGKTVASAQGRCIHKGVSYILVDLPGTYSLMAHSAEEEVARDFICFGEPDAAVVVCDASCLEKNLNLVLQTLEITDRAVVCINLMDEAKKKKIHVDLKKLSDCLGVPVVGASARSGKGISDLMDQVNAVCTSAPCTPLRITYPEPMMHAVHIIEPCLREHISRQDINIQWVALKLIDDDETLHNALEEYLGTSLAEGEELSAKIREARGYLEEQGITLEKLKDMTVSSIVLKSEEICHACLSFENSSCNEHDRRLDKIFTSKWTGIPVMLLLLAIIFWLTITGANYPSQLLSDGLFWVSDRLTDFFHWLHAPAWLTGVLIDGMYRVLAWVISVMLPPMAIFFPLFTLLEDFGYLPRVAFNLDKYFKKACACGKQALTMCMGFGCNAAGVTGCRIIDSPRERLIAIITNNFVPCNGRFPTLIAIITMFFAGSVAAPFDSILSTLLLTGVIVFGIFMTFTVSRLLSKTILKGMPSSFALELPPYRRPQIGKVIVRSIFDRTLFVLGRAIAVAAPAGIIIWLFANIQIGGVSILAHCTGFLDPFAKLLGLDGVILMAFILGLPANEIVVPIIIMSYLATGNIVEMGNLMELKSLLVDNGWTWLTAICTMLFSLMHWPCSTTCMTIKKETGSLKWTAVSFLVPAIFGIVICFIVASATRILGLV